MSRYGGIEVLVVPDALPEQPAWFIWLPDFRMKKKLGRGSYVTGELAGNPIFAAHVRLGGVECHFNGRLWIRPVPGTGLPMVWTAPLQLLHVLEVSSLTGERLWRSGHYCLRCLRNTGRPTIRQPRWATKTNSIRFICRWCATMWVHQLPTSPTLTGP